MLTFSHVAGGGPQAAMRMARHLSVPTRPPDHARLHARLARTWHDDGHSTLARWRDDLDPGYPSILAVDLTRPLRLDEVAALLQGRRADGGPIPGKPPAKGAFTDFTVSAEKDFSILWALSSPAEQALLEGVHRDAVCITMRVIEEAIGLARLGRGGRDGYQRGTIAWMAFDQMTARPSDPIDAVAPSRGAPNLHTHVIVPHLVRLPSGRVRAPDLQGVRHRILELGAIARAETVRGLRRHGVAVSVDPQTGFFRIPGVPNALREAFSQRTMSGREAARQYLARTGEDLSRVSERRRIGLTKAGVQARFSGPRRDDLADFEHWRSVADAHGWSPRLVPRDAGAYCPAPVEDRRESALAHILVRLETLFATRSLIDHQSLRTIAAQVGVSAPLESTEIEPLISALTSRSVRQDGKLRPLRLIAHTDRRGNIATHLTADLEPEATDELAALLRGTISRVTELAARAADGARANSLEVIDAHTSCRWTDAIEAAARERDWCWVGGNGGRAKDHPFSSQRTSLTQLATGPEALPAVILIGDLGLHHPRDLLRFLRRLNGKEAQITLRLFIRGDHADFFTDAVFEILRAAWPELRAAPLLHDPVARRMPRVVVAGGEIKGAVAQARQLGLVRLIGGGRETFAQEVASRWLDERGRRGKLPVIAVVPSCEKEYLVAAVRARLRQLGLLRGPDYEVETVSAAGAPKVVLAVGDLVVLGKRVNAQRQDRRRGLFAVAGSHITITSIAREGLRALNRQGHEGLITWTTLRHPEGGYSFDQGYVVSAHDPGGVGLGPIWAVRQDLTTAGPAWLRSFDGAQQGAPDLLLVAREALAPPGVDPSEAPDELLWEALVREIQAAATTPATRARTAALSAQRSAADALRQTFYRLERAGDGAVARKLRRHRPSQLFEQQPSPALSR